MFANSSPEPLQVLLSNIPEAASGTQATIMYIAVVVSWTILGWRIRRNKNLLRNIEKLPPGDRTDALIAEMGAVRVPKDLTPDQWLRYRVHRYYFLAFIVGAIALGTITFLALTYASPDEESRAKKFAESLRTGVTKTYVEHTLGPPMLQEEVAGTTQAEYHYRDFSLLISYYNGEVVDLTFGLVPGTSYRPPIPHLEGARLNFKSLEDISPAGEGARYYSSDSGGSGGPWFSEYHELHYSEGENIELLVQEGLEGAWQIRDRPEKGGVPDDYLSEDLNTKINDLKCLSPDKRTGLELRQPGYFSKEELDNINAYRSNHRASGYTLTTIYPPDELKKRQEEISEAVCMK